MDLDKSGIQKRAQREYLGPSLGWTDGQANVLAIAAGGTTLVSINITLVTVNFAGAVTIQLPRARRINPILGTIIGFPLTVVDIGGNATASPITILPAAGETIMGLASIQLSVNYGSYVLLPNTVSGGWNAR